MKQGTQEFGLNGVRRTETMCNTQTTSFVLCRNEPSTGKARLNPQPIRNGGAKGSNMLMRRIAAQEFARIDKSKKWSHAGPEATIPLSKGGHLSLTLPHPH